MPMQYTPCTQEAGDVAGKIIKIALNVFERSENLLLYIQGA